MNRVLRSSLEKSASIVDPEFVVQQFWTRNRLRIEIEGPDGNFVTDLNQPFARIGSHPGSDIRISPPQSSRRHFYLQIVGNRILGFDFDKNVKSGKRSHLRIESGRPINSGPYKITASILPAIQRWLPDEPTPGLAGVNRSTRLDLCAMVQLRGKDSAPYAFSNRLVTVGRHPTNKIKITSEGVSKFHCVLFEINGSIWAVDLRANSPTRVAGKLFDAGQVPLGSRVQIGPASIIFDHREKLSTALIKVGKKTSTQPDNRALETRLKVSVAEFLEKYLDELRKLKTQVIINQACLRREREEFELQVASALKSRSQHEQMIALAIHEVGQRQTELDRQQEKLQKLAGELTSKSDQLATTQSEADAYLSTLEQQREALSDAVESVQAKESQQLAEQLKNQSKPNETRRKSRWRTPGFLSQLKQTGQPHIEQGVQCQLNVIANIQKLRRSSN
jgi:pSer/pThr/pTyr-binding forkhead associated (FHA) protein